jgi:hypothetical protein
MPHSNTKKCYGLFKNKNCRQHIYADIVVALMDKNKHLTGLRDLTTVILNAELYTHNNNR